MDKLLFGWMWEAARDIVLVSFVNNNFDNQKWK